MMNLRIDSCRTLHSFLSVEHSLFKALEKGFGKRFLSRLSLLSSKKAKYTTVFAVIAVILVSFLAFFPVEDKGVNSVPQDNADPSVSSISQNPTNTTENSTNETEKIETGLPQGVVNKPVAPSPRVLLPSKPLGIMSSAQVINRTIWKAVAKHAWQYFQPGIVDPVTGLPSAGCGYPYFTDWDLGVYVQAVIDAQDIGLIEREGSWGADDRFEKVLAFLENRRLTNDSLPFWFYQAGDGSPGSQSANCSGTVADTGRLLVALQNLKTYNNSLETRIDYVVNNRMNYSFMLNELDTLVKSNNIYDYFVASGFAAFWSNKSNVPASIMDNIMSAQQVDLHGAQLPISKIACEPILLSIFDLSQPDPRLFNLSRQVYLAHENWYSATGKFRAFSEGPTISGKFAYEWVVMPDGRTWVVQDEEGQDFNISPVIYSKVAFSFLAIHNTVHARNIVVHLENALPDLGSGYCDGIHEDGRNKVDITGSNTNGLIISAARYAIESGDWP